MGGLFRHVRDLAKAQYDAGHCVGLICDSLTGSDAAASQLASLAASCELGIRRLPMSRQLGLRDLGALHSVREFARTCEAEILHGHGAKGGAYARLAATSLRRSGRPIVSFYTPHGGSLHYDPESVAGRLFITLERWLAPRSDGLIFESRYSAGLFEKKIAPYPCPHFVVPNGLWPEEFKRRRLVPGAADFLFVGELRHLKGVDVLIEAVAGIVQDRSVSVLIVGTGPDEADFKESVANSGLEQNVKFVGAMPAEEAFGQGRCLIVPSRAESLPYIVLEAAAAKVPMILTGVGGIPEITEGTDTPLLDPGDAQALQASMTRYLENPAQADRCAEELHAAVSQRFAVAEMSASIAKAYDQILLSGKA